MSCIAYSILKSFEMHFWQKWSFIAGIAADAAGMGMQQAIPWLMANSNLTHTFTYDDVDTKDVKLPSASQEVKM